MVMTKNPMTVAAPGVLGTPSLVVSALTPEWPAIATHRVHGTGVARGTQAALDVPNPMSDRVSRHAAKQDRPPRGVPR